MPITLARAALRDPSAGQLPLCRQIVLDEGGDDLVDVAVAVEAEGFGARRQQRLRPARDDRLDLRVGLPADPGIGALAAGAAQCCRHLPDRDREARQLQ